MARKAAPEKIEETIIKTEYSDVMQKSYIDYAMSVIVSRALPDVRDGLKPVQRRTLYDMYELNNRYDRPHLKSARIVGDTMGKYHPHGDSSIYDCLVVMSQDFKKGMALVDGHGNFGSIEGDGAAAMRYTEARLEKITQEEMLSDLDKDVVDFMPNYDETGKEPAVLPCRFPNLLVNGSEGIAVGMATSMPPHNLSEVIEAEKAFIKNPMITTAELLEIMPGPDFPTGGIVTNKDELLEIYESGTGKIKVRGKIELEVGKGGKPSLVITEIPYTMIGANISKFLLDIVSLIDAKKTTDIVDISNQSSKEGIRIVIELKKDADVENVRNMLLKKTRLEDTFGVNMLAICDGRPEVLGLRAIISHHVNFLRELATRKYRTLLTRELEKKEIQEGLIKAVDVIDVIIEILRGSKDVKIAKQCLIEGVTEGINFKSRISQKVASSLRFTEKQASAILDMRLYKLIGLEMEALIAEHEKTLKDINEYKEILTKPAKMDATIVKGLDSIRKTYGRERRTVIDNAAEVVFEENKTEEMEVVFLMDRFGYAKTVDVPTFDRNRDAIDEEFKISFTCLNTSRICVFTKIGVMHSIKVSDLPFGKFRDKGIPIDNVSNYNSDTESIVYVLPMSDLVLQKLMFGTRKGMFKQVYGTEFDVIKRTVAATSLLDDDELITVFPVTDQKYIVLQTEFDVFLKFELDEIPVKKKGAVGVRAIKLTGNDRVENVYYLYDQDDTTVEVGSRQILLSRLKSARRDTKGSKLRG
ncbi:MAG: DNA topoisomerase 4 subunit A [Lachnospiraceae bacterium]|nr:DNA topoisomerase 4 subunit A [Lachnospiraceae bacterium]